MSSWDPCHEAPPLSCFDWECSLSHWESAHFLTTPRTLPTTILASNSLSSSQAAKYLAMDSYGSTLRIKDTCKNEYSKNKPTANLKHNMEYLYFKVKMTNETRLYCSNNMEVHGAGQQLIRAFSGVVTLPPPQRTAISGAYDSQRQVRSQDRQHCLHFYKSAVKAPDTRKLRK